VFDRSPKMHLCQSNINLKIDIPNSLPSYILAIENTHLDLKLIFFCDQQYFSFRIQSKKELRHKIFILRRRFSIVVPGVEDGGGKHRL